MTDTPNYMLRFPPRMRDRIKALAWANGRSMMAEMIHALSKHLAQSERPVAVAPESAGQSDIIRLPVGAAVVKLGGYPFPGEIRTGFTTIAGNERFVVEATGEGYAGMLHIFNGGQLRRIDQEPS